MYDDFMFLQMAVKTVVPPGTRLDGSAPPPPTIATTKAQPPPPPSLPAATVLDALDSKKASAKPPGKQGKIKNSAEPSTAAKEKTSSANPKTAATAKKADVGNTTVPKPKTKGQTTTMKQSKLPMSLTIPPQLTQNLLAAQKTLTPLPLSASTHGFSAVTPAKETSATRTAATGGVNKFISPPSAASVWRGPVPKPRPAAGLGSRNLMNMQHPSHQPAQAPPDLAPPRQHRASAAPRVNEAGKTLTPAFGRFAFNSKAPSPPAARTQINEPQAVSVAPIMGKMGRHAYNETRPITVSTSEGEGGNGGRAEVERPAMPAKRLKIGSSLNWLSSKFQAVDSQRSRGLGGNENKNEHGSGAAVPAMDIDVSQALEFL